MLIQATFGDNRHTGSNLVFTFLDISERDEECRKSIRAILGFLKSLGFATGDGTT
jgi:hypothetical protein